MSDRELRARLEELQGAIKAAQEALAAPDPEEHVSALSALSTNADEAEAAAAAAEHESDEERAYAERLREDVERREQDVLAPKTTRDMPALSILFTVAAFAGSVVGWVTVYQQPRTVLIMWTAQAVSAAAMIPAAWIIKRRLMRPRQGPG